jgi:hypothetical protein
VGATPAFVGSVRVAPAVVEAVLEFAAATDISHICYKKTPPSTKENF